MSLTKKTKALDVKMQRIKAGRNKTCILIHLMLKLTSNKLQVN